MPVRTMALDATPLLGPRSGVGRYVMGLLDGLAQLDDAPDALLALFSIRGELPTPLPRRARPAPRRAPARLLRRAWARWEWPPIELLTGRVDVFHGTNFVLPPLRRAAGIVTVHDLTYLYFPDMVTGDVAQYSWLVPDAVRRAARVVTVSHSVADGISVELGVPRDEIVVAHNGVHQSWFHAVPLSAGGRTEFGLPERYLVFVGNLEPRKNLRTLLAAHALARRESKDVPQLVLVGPPGWGDRWEGWEPDPADVVIVGYLPDDTLRSVVVGSVALCAPSRYEGFGLPVVEALSTGTAVIASDIAAHREVGGDLARYAAHDDVNAWAQAALDASRVPVDDPQIRAARRDHASRFTWVASAQTHLAAYRAAVS